MSSDLGIDRSGNGNNWTTNNIAYTDQVVDSPTNNFCTWNPIDSFDPSALVLSEGNLKFELSTSRCRGTIASQVDGKIYFEVYNPTLVSNTNVHHMGLGSISLDINNASNMETAAGGGAVVWTYANANGRNIYARQNGSNVAQVALPNQIAAGDIISFASDSSTGKVWMAQNNSWLKANGSFDGTNALSSSNYLFQLATGHELAPLTMPVGNYVGILNCGQDSSFAGNKTPQGNQDSNDIGDFFYAPPSGFLALCTSNLPDVDVIPSENFNTVLYTGNGGTSQTVTGVGFPADFVWIKGRSIAAWHRLQNTVGGINKLLFSNDTSAEVTNEVNGYVSAVSSDGFNLADPDGNGGGVNGNGSTYVAWNWKAGGSASSNSNGSITSSVSANAAAGFSILTYTGTGVLAATIGHGLSSAPEMIIRKDRDTAVNWVAYHASMGTGNGNLALFLNTTSAQDGGQGFMNNTAPTSTVFTQGDQGFVGVNGNDYISYCFHSVDGYSLVGSYIGNGSTDGVYVHCGFSPALIITKSLAATGWRTIDNKRTPYNPSKASIYPDSSDAEYTGTGHETDFTANGFKMRNSNSRLNTNGQTYIFIAFAETPFKFSNAR